MLGGLRFGEILIILLVVLVLFGKDRLPNIGSSLGQAIRNFKKGFDGHEETAASPEQAQLQNGGIAAATSPVVDPSKVASKQG
jgi:sec-independent protein translocase protein TatA